jgi:hypothetical protein
MYKRNVKNTNVISLYYRYLPFQLYISFILAFHIACDTMNYSVPYEYIKHKVDVRLTQSMVEVFYQGTRIASHKRLYGHSGQYSTVSEHMPEKHRQYTQWNAERFIRWACDIGPSTGPLSLPGRWNNRAIRPALPS